MGRSSECPGKKKEQSLLWSGALGVVTADQALNSAENKLHLLK